MIEFHAPYLIPAIFLFFVLCIGFSLGNIYAELVKWTEGDGNQELRWLLLLVPSAIGCFVILWWPTVQLGGG